MDNKGQSTRGEKTVPRKVRINDWGQANAEQKGGPSGPMIDPRRKFLGVWSYPGEVGVKVSCAGTINGTPVLVPEF